jgi:phage shock protein E
MSLRLTLSALVVSLPLLLAGCSGDDPTIAAAMPRLVAPAEAVALIAQPGTVLLDVRTPAEFAQGHVADARNIDINDSAFRHRLSRLDLEALAAVGAPRA